LGEDETVAQADEHSRGEPFGGDGWYHQLYR
jgi:hypothetical protein